MLKHINKLLIDAFFNVISNFSASLNSTVNLRDDEPSKSLLKEKLWFDEFFKTIFSLPIRIALPNYDSSYGLSVWILYKQFHCIHKIDNEQTTSLYS